MEKEFTEFIKKGSEYIKKGEYTKSIACFQSAVAINPDSAEAHYQLAESFYHNKQMKEALKHYEKSLKLNSNDFDVYFQLGRTYYKLKEYPKSLENFQKAHEIDPSNGKPIRALGILCFKTEAIERGKQFFIQYFENSPSDIETKELFINLLIDAKQIEDAIYFLKEFIGFDKQYQLSNYDQERYQFLLKFSELMDDKHEFQLLVNIFEPLVLQYPDDITICSIYGNASVELVVHLCRENRFNEAKKVIQLNYSIEKRQAQLETKNNEDEIISFSAHIRLGYAEGFISHDNICEGISFLYWLYDQDPDFFWKKDTLHPLKDEFLGLLYDIINEVYPGIDYAPIQYEDPLEKFRNGEITPRIRIAIAEILLFEPYLKEIALIELKKVSEDISADWQHRLSVANLSITHNLDLDFALSELNRALVLNPNHSTIYYLRAIIYLKTGQYEEFYQSIKIGIEKNSNALQSYVEKILEYVLKVTSHFGLLKIIITRIEFEIDQISYKFSNYALIKSHFDLMLGILYENENNNLDAIRYYEAALKDNEDFSFVYPYLGNVLIKENRMISAAESFLKGRSKTNNRSVTFEKCTEGLAILAITQTNWRDAFDYYDELRKLHPNNKKYDQKALESYQNLKYLISNPTSIPEEEIKIAEKEVDKWEKNIRQLILERILDYEETLFANEHLAKSIEDERIKPYISQKPYLSPEDIKHLDFFNPRDYPKVILKNKNFQALFGSETTFKLNINCIADFRNTLKHNRPIDSSEFYHAKAALIWFEKIFEKNIEN